MSGFPDPQALDRQALQRALDGLSRHLAERDIRAHIYVVGGAAMVLAHGSARLTRDVDALAIDRREEVLDAAHRVAEELGLARSWLNDAVRTAPWPTPRQEGRTAVVYDSPHLVVTGASAEQLLAMKIRAGREADREDIELLIRRLGISTLLHVQAIHDAVFPHDSIPERNMEIIIECLERVEDARHLGPDHGARHSRDFGPER